MKKVKIIICTVVVLLIAAGVTAFSVLQKGVKYDIDSIGKIGNSIEIVSRENENTVIKKTDGEDFKVLLFTDLHIDGKSTSETTVTRLVENITREKPDLVILGGDNVTASFNKKRSKQLAQIFENLDVYWAAVLGNHEGDNPLAMSREKTVDLFSSYSHCLIGKSIDDIWGNGNCTITVLNSDDTVKETFFLMDSGNRVSKENKEKYGIPADDNPYDGVKESQVMWYGDTVKALKEKYGEVPSVLVMHIPLPQYETAVEQGKLLYGDKRENICESGFDSGLFAAIKENGSTHTVFCGHDHINNFGVMYDGVLLSYIEASGYGSYTMASKFGSEEKDWLQGYTVLDLNTDGTFTQTQVRNCEIK